MLQEQFQKAFKKCTEENRATLQKYGMNMRPTFVFPGKKKVPILAKLGIWFMRRVGGRLDIEYFEFSYPQHQKRKISKKK